MSEPLVPMVRSENPGEIAFLHGLFEESGLDYRSVTEFPPADGASMMQVVGETFFVPASCVPEARAMLLAGIAEIPELRARVAAIEDWSAIDEHAGDGLGLLLVRAAVVGLFVVVLAGLLSRVLSQL